MADIHQVLHDIKDSFSKFPAPAAVSSDSVSHPRDADQDYSLLYKAYSGIVDKLVDAVSAVGTKDARIAQQDEEIRKVAKALEDEKAEKAVLLAAKTAELEAEKERERTEKERVTTLLAAKEAELRAREAAADRSMLARERTQRTNFLLIADELKKVCDGRDPDFNGIVQGMGEKFTSLWEGMSADNTVKTRITNAIKDVITKVHNLRGEARQVVINRSTSEERLCRHCARDLNGGDRRRKLGN